MGFFYKTKGAISIFLIIVLLPMMTIAGVFIDISRSKLAQETVVSSADLALNTVLSTYDKDLKDYFGLFGSVQKPEEAITLAKEYFAESLQSKNFDTSTFLSYINNITSATGINSEIYDMLLLTTDGEVNIKGSDNGALNNPALLKTQIVEFMKYRAPVNGVAKLFEKLANEDVGGKVEAASLEATMTEKKKIFYEKEKALIKQAEKAYKAIKKYQNYKTSTGKKISDEQFLHDLSKFLEAPNNDGRIFETVFREAHALLVKDLFNTHNANGDNAISLMSLNSIDWQSAVTTYSDRNKASANTIKSRINDFNTKMKDYYSKRSALNTAWNNVGAKTNSDYSIQYWVVLTKNCKTAYNEYAAAAEKLWKSANQLENAVTYAADEAMNTNMSKPSNQYVTYTESNKTKDPTYDTIYTDLITHYKNSLKNEVSGSKRGCSSYKNINSQLNNLDTTTNRNKLKLENIGHIFTIRNKLNNYKSNLEQAAKYAKDAKTQTNKLKKLLDDYKKAFEEWDKAAHASGLENSELAKTDRKEIQNLKNTGIEKFSKQSVIDLTDRLKKIEELWSTLAGDMKNIKYRSAKVIDLSDYSKLRSKSGISADRIVRNNGSLNSYVTESFSFSIGTQIQRVIIRDDTSGQFDNGQEYTINNNNHPNVEKTKMELYEWMKKTFSGSKPAVTLNEKTHGFSVDDEDSAEDADGDINSKSESTETASTDGNIKSGKSFSEWNGAALPTSSNTYQTEETELTAKISEAADYVGEIFGNFTSTFMSSLVSMRDDLFALDYIFSMFTHDVFENEGYYNNLSDENKSKIKASNATQYYKQDVKNAWNEKDNKTLTLTPRTADYNWAYGSEIEYILYGNKSNDTNKNTTYANIYLIRYAFDLAAVFKTYWIDELVDVIATTLQALAYIPIPLTKTLICLAITAAEAGIDISYLKKGIPVQLIKISKEDLFCNYESVFLDNDSKNVSITSKLSLQYSDYLKIFMYLKLLGSNENAIYARSGDIIQANLSLATKDYKFALSKAYAYFDIDATVIMEPMWSRLLAVDDLGDLSSSKGWRSIHINMRRGY